MKQSPRIIRALLGPTIGAILILAPSAFAQDIAEETATLRGYFSGNGLLNRGMYDLALAEYSRFLDEHADHEKAPVARYGLAVCLSRLGRNEEAATELVRLRALPEFQYATEVLMILGQCRLALSAHADAAGCFGEVVRDHPEHALADDAAALQAEAFYKIGAFEAVKGPCSMLASRWPESPVRERGELFWGLSEMARGEHVAAAKRFRQMAQQFPNGEYADQTSLLLAQCLHRSGTLDQAAAKYRGVIEQAGDTFVADAMYGLALILYRQEGLQATGELVDQLLQRFPEVELAASARLLRGRVWFDLEDFDRASALFDELAKLEGDHRDDAIYWLAKCDLRRDEPQRAATRLREALDQFADSDLRPEMTYDRAVALLRVGDTDRALEALGDVLTAFPEQALAATALQLMAATQHQQRRYEESLELCRTFNQRHPEHELAATVAFLSAENTFLMKRFDQAEKAYRALLEKYPDHPNAVQARYRLGMALYHVQTYDQAEELLAGIARGRETEAGFRPALLALGDGAFQRSDWPAAEQHLDDYLSFGLDQPSADDALLKLGLARQRQGKLPSAIEALDRIIDRFSESPHRPQAIFERGQVLVALDRHLEAANAFQQVLAESPGSRFTVHALNHLGAITLQRERFDEAAEYFGRAASAAEEPELASEALYQQGNALLSSQQFESAAAVLARFIDEHAEHKRVPQAWALKAIATARQGLHEPALADVKRVEDRYARDLSVSLRTTLLYEKAWCLRKLERPEESAAAYRDVLSEPGEGGLRDHAMLELAGLEIDAERYEQAADLLRRLRQIAVESSDLPEELREQCTYRLGVCEFRLRNYPAASELLEEFLNTYPESELVASASRLCGEAFFASGSHERAAVHFTRVVEEFETDDAYEPSLLRLGDCLAALQRWRRSEEVHASYLERFADSPRWYQAQFGLGFARENQGRYDGAISAYREVVSRHQGPTAARAQFQIGECLFAQRHFEEAARELLKVDILYAYPQWSAGALYEAGRCFQEMSNPVDARKQFEQVQQKHAETHWAKLATERLDELSRSSLPGH